jgi:large subunit ribosomal protein L19
MISVTKILTPVSIEKRKALNLSSGDTVRVWQKIKEGDKTRLQAFEGLCLARKHGTQAGATFTVRKMVGGIGVEKIFPLYSPNIDKIEILKRSDTRRSKLYFIREKAAREIKKKLRSVRMGKSEVMNEQDVAVPAEDAALEKGE